MDKQAKQTKKQPLLELKTLRESKGFTQESLARAINVAKNTIGFYEQTGRIPTVPIFFEICRVLKVSPKTLAKAFDIDITGIPEETEEESN